MSVNLSHSLRARLLWLLFAAVIATACAQALVAYRTALTEANSIFDFQMQEMALSLRSGLPINDGFGRKSIEEENEEEKFDFVIQIWMSDGRRVFRSTARAGLPRQKTLGFTTIDVRGTSYRIFLASSGDQFIQIAQGMDARRDLARTLALKTVSPVLVMVPLLLVLVWWVVSTSLAPVARVQKQIADREPDALTEVSEVGLPDEVQPLVHELNLLLLRMGQAFEAQKNFVADAAHELRSPLAALRLQVEGLRRANGESGREVAIGRLGAGIDRATRLVEQLLVLARQQALPASKLGETKADVCEVVSATLADMLPAAQSKGIDLGVVEAQPCFVYGHADALRIMVRNLIENAIKYAPVEGKVDIALRQEGEAVVLTIEDNGPGIPVDDQERVLDRFYRVAGAEGTGSGLGLSIVKTIADLHGARILLAKSDCLSGLRVRVTFKNAATS